MTKQFVVAVVLALAVGLIVGAVLGYFGRSTFSPTLKTTVDVVQILNLLVAIFVAFVIQNYLVGHRSNTRIEKDMLIDQAKTLRPLSGEILDSAKRSTESKEPAPDPTLLLGKFKLLRGTAESLTQECRHCFGDKHSDLADALLKAVIAFDHATTVDFPHKAMSVDGLLECEKAFRALDKEVWTFIIAVNRR